MSMKKLSILVGAVLYICFSVYIFSIDTSAMKDVRYTVLASAQTKSSWVMSLQNVKSGEIVDKYVSFSTYARFPVGRELVIKETVLPLEQVNLTYIARCIILASFTSLILIAIGYRDVLSDYLKS